MLPASSRAFRHAPITRRTAGRRATAGPATAGSPTAGPACVGPACVGPACVGPACVGSPEAGRRGVVAVEFAMVLTLAFLFFFAAFEFCRVAMIRHTVDNAVYEGARRGIIPGGDAADVANTARRILATVGVRDATVTVQPSTITRNTDHVTVSVRVPLDSNSYVPANFFRGKVIDRSLSMRREGTR